MKGDGVSGRRAMAGNPLKWKKERPPSPKKINRTCNIFPMTENIK